VTPRAKDKRSPNETPLSSKKVSEFIYYLVCKNFHTLLEGIGDLAIMWLKKNKKALSKISVTPPPELLATQRTLHVKYQSNPLSRLLHVALYIYQYVAL